ncbi:hypothetical protein AF893_13695 [Listeria monocytogenes]|uniref:hypothetical protein n=1 Tax=Listeria monocytogenes TaxID=1639 RepID=UPI000854D5DF|nr:hypothetical protein [Listeria monocytogenes]OEP06424.1 hypothetical protein AF893_13695 [Listeria monocytogenes]
MEYIEFFNHICQKTILKDFVFRKLLVRRKRVKKDTEIVIPNDTVIYIDNTYFLREIHFENKVYYDLLEGGNFVFVTKEDSEMILVPLVDTEYNLFNKNDLFKLLESEKVLSCFYLMYVKKIQEGIRFNLKISQEETWLRVIHLLDKLFEKKESNMVLNTFSLQNIARIVDSSYREMEEAILILQAKGYIQKSGKKLIYYHCPKIVSENGALKID